jgi:antirestriction protein
MVVIEESWLEELLIAQATLEQLEGAGVDNWEGSEYIDYDAIKKDVAVQMHGVERING